MVKATTSAAQVDILQAEIDELNKQLAVTSAILTKVLEQTGPIKITSEDFAKSGSDDVGIELDFNEKKDFWKVYLGKRNA